MDINKKYQFNVKSNNINRKGKYYSILRGENGNTYYFPYHLNGNKKYELEFKGKDEEAYYFSLNKDLLKIYAQGEEYDFKVEELKEFENDKGEIYKRFVVFDKLGVKRSVRPFPWQLEGPYKLPDELKCRVERIKGNNLDLQQVSGEQSRHPFFEVNL
jgi:hypothetical protein